MPQPVALVVVTGFKLLRTNHALVIISAVGSHVSSECVLRLQLIPACRADIAGFLLAILLVQVAQRGDEEGPLAVFPHSTRIFAFIWKELRLQFVVSVNMLPSPNSP